jgi:hypothetical protein
MNMTVKGSVPWTETRYLKFSMQPPMANKKCSFGGFVLTNKILKIKCRSSIKEIRLCVVYGT